LPAGRGVGGSIGLSVVLVDTKAPSLGIFGMMAVAGG
jgi:hypothetical protein